MKFSDFTQQTQVEKILGLRVEKTAFTPGKAVEPLAPSATLIDVLERAEIWPSESELALRETLISPVLSEIFLHFLSKLTFFSSEELKFDPDPAAPIPGELTLTGTFDYLISGVPNMRRPQTPILCVVEAKREDFETGTWQCTAELYAARLLNLRDGKNIPVYYGCITTGKLWTFIQLENNLLTTDRFSYSLDNLPRLLGVWRWILDKQIESLEQN